MYRRRGPCRGSFQLRAQCSRDAPGLGHASLLSIDVRVWPISEVAACPDCYDNAPMESFFHTLKTELVHHQHYATREEARRDIFAYIEGFYNRTRRHSAIGYLSPFEMENPVHFFGGKIKAYGGSATRISPRAVSLCS
jgi:Integrase core domain